MQKIKNKFLGKRSFGGPESVMRVLSLWLMKKSRKVTNVNTDMQEERVSHKLNWHRWMMMMMTSLQQV